MPPVDIIIIPDTDGMSLKSLWTPGTFGQPYLDTPCNNTDLTGKVDLSYQIPTPLFQDWIACWKAKDRKNTYHPQFLLQGLHLLLPEHQVALLGAILSHAGPSDSTGRPPLFITVTSLPTVTLASRLLQFSLPGVYYINLDGMKADISLLEGILLNILKTDDIPPLKIHKLAHVLAASPEPAFYLKRLRVQVENNPFQWEKYLDPILAAPWPEVRGIPGPQMMKGGKRGEVGALNGGSNEDHGFGGSDGGGLLWR
jgi:hypothetical protein